MSKTLRNMAMCEDLELQEVSAELGPDPKRQRTEMGVECTDLEVESELLKLQLRSKDERRPKAMGHPSIKNYMAIRPAYMLEAYITI